MKLFRSYYNSYTGLRKEVWWLSGVTFINRAGSMVIPFLSLYLTKDQGFSLSQVGWVMSSFGLGSLAGAWLGGKLTDKIGYHPVMFWSLIISGLMFIALQFIGTFTGICIGVFFIMLFADSFRPALFVAVGAYSKPENRTRSISLIRFAINLGFSFGPALGGLLIVTMGYSGLFWVDGVTCVAAALVFVYVLKAKDHKHVKSEATGPDIRSPYKDKSFLIFLLVMMLVAFVFLQLFSTMPLFYSDQFGLMEDEIGWLMGFNGLFIFVLEMPLIKKLEGDQYSKFRILIWSTVLIGLSFLVLNLTSWVGILWISMLLVTLGEMLNFPVGNTWAINRAEGGKKGEYMGLYTMCFAIAHIFGHNTGMQLIDAFGYDITWLIMGLLSLVAVFLLRWLERREQAAG